MLRSACGQAAGSPRDVLLQSWERTSAAVAPPQAGQTIVLIGALRGDGGRIGTGRQAPGEIKGSSVSLETDLQAYATMPRARTGPERVP